MLFMTRPLRSEFSGALYHVTARGDRRESIYVDDEDRREWLNLLDEVCHRFNWVIHAYCQMTNHYHFVVETPDANLSKGMRQLNGVYTQRFNRRHGLVGHLFQGRYKAILVQKESYLLELSRYVVLNPSMNGVRSNIRTFAVVCWLRNSWDIYGPSCFARIEFDRATKESCVHISGLLLKQVRFWP